MQDEDSVGNYIYQFDIIAPQYRKTAAISEEDYDIDCEYESDLEEGSVQSNHLKLALNPVPEKPKVNI